MTEKYGFVYIWRDKKRKMYYIGSHWGTIDDGYICSSNRMRDAYRRRPNDFKRRILNILTDRKLLLDEEHKWLSLIKLEELGVKYYNLRQHKWGHWSTDVNKSQSVGEKISKAKRGGKHSKKREYTPEGLEKVRNNTREIQKRRTYYAPTSDETKQKQKESRLAFFANGGSRTNSGSFQKGQEPWNKGKKASEETKIKMSQSQKGRTHSEEHKIMMKEKLTGRIFVHNPNTLSQNMIYKEELENYINNGYVLGRLSKQL